jgi:hypothetical protein
MSVEVQYQGRDPNFAWILPVIAPPTEIGIASPALFSALDAATTPTFVTRSETRGTCRSHPTCVYPDTGATAYDWGGCGTSASPSGWEGGYVDASAADSAVSFDTGAGDASMPGVTVYSSDTIGPYDTVVLGAATAAEVVDWLQTNDYDVPETSTELLEPYAAAGQVFVALRLSANQARGTLRPIRLRIPTDEACLPIRLTAIASVPRLPVRAFFLGSEYVAPQNYATAVVPDDAEYWSGARSFTADVDREIVRLEGRAFHVDYAGRTPAVSLALPPVNDLASVTDAAGFINALAMRGYNADPILPELLARFMTPPASSDSVTYYNCLALNDVRACGEPAFFDPAALASAIQTEITEPRLADEELVYSHPRLTRLYTNIAVADMTLDPIFVEEPRMPDTPAVHEATLITECDSGVYEEDAAQHLDIGGDEYPTRSRGPNADDSAYCRSRGLVLESEAPPPRTTSSSSSSCGGCHAGGNQLSFGLLMGLVLLVIFRDARRR